MARRARRGAAAVVVAIAVLTLAACSTPRSSRSPGPSVSPSASSPAPYVSAPIGDQQPTTAPGTDLGLGDPATVWWKPTTDQKALLGLRVTAIHRTTFKRSFKGWKITPETARTTPYFVDARVSASAKAVAGRQVPLYALDSKNQLVQASSFKQAFKPCGPSTFPLHAKHGHVTDVCLVYLLPAATHLVGVTYRPDQSLEPITWRGAPTPLTGKSDKKS